MANMCRSRTGDWSVVIGPGLALALGLLYIFVYIFSFSSLVRVVANLRRCLHYHIMKLLLSMINSTGSLTHNIFRIQFTEISTVM